LFLREVGNVTGHGGSDDQAASAPLSEMKTNSPSAVECSVQISLDNLVPCLDGAIQDTGVGGTAGIGDEDIDLAKVFDNVCNQLLNVLVVANVALVWLGFDTILLLKLFGVLLPTLFTGRVSDGYISTHFGASSCSLSSDAGGTRSTSYDNDLALQAK
jgi:hypothetical protein